ncbi:MULTISPECIES: histidine kinase [unclassified Tolypothrix]|uniref:histidine kinase n=1 Tax=unclassified Tolypothrix TaxID=2649714 RepID=UPI000BBC1403|nr:MULTISPECIES: histidine kinase [unclassified Tolypothrix]UYD26175.1 histidine kinase [Tolypothrix sp. PCC 7712]UYD31588.1 histidine kinase [Tolypothrix sp. PCC 7601]
MGTGGEEDEGDEGDEGDGKITVSNYQCPMPYALCPMPYAPCPISNTQSFLG